MNCLDIIQSHDLTSEVGINQALLAASVSDGLLYDVLRELRYKDELTRKVALEAFESICHFYDQSSDARMARFAQRKIRDLAGSAFQSELLHLHNNNLAGVELSNSERSQFVLFLPDASEPGRVRHSNFDRHGFYNHYTFDTYVEALKSAWSQGFRMKAPGALNDLCTKADWIRGTKITNAIQHLNAGRISYQQYLAEIA